jgi:Prenyltransferase and squalene oxidase repeat
VAPTFAQAPVKDRLSDSVDRGLAFLALLQEKDGAWQLSGAKHPAVTSLAVMAYLSAGHVPGEGAYRANIEKGVRWVLDQQQPSGVIAVPTYEEMYQHGIATMMLCEVAGMCDAKTARDLKPAIEKAVKIILKAQRTEKGVNRGGWRYRVDSPDADMSVTGWQILALRAARNLGCDVPAERVEMAMEFVKQCRDAREGGFAYIPGAQVSVACTGTAVLALELCGKDRHLSREAALGGSYVLNHPLKLGDPNFFYSAYYSSQAMFQLGNNYWSVFRPRLHKLLLDGQKGNGSWIDNEPHGASFTTAMAILALTVEYRLLPLYQRDDDSGSVKK